VAAKKQDAVKQSIQSIQSPPPVHQQKIQILPQKKELSLDPSKLNVKNKGKNGPPLTLPQKSTIFTPVKQKHVEVVNKLFSVKNIKPSRPIIPINNVVFQKAQIKPKSQPDNQPIIPQQSQQTKSKAKAILPQPSLINKMIPKINRAVGDTGEVKKKAHVIKRCNCGR